VSNASNEGNDGGMLAGKVAVVTGATSGSGRAIARRFVEAGAHVYMLARGAERLKEMEGLLGRSAIGLPTDIGDPDSVRTAFARVEADHQKLDILINNAAIYRPIPFEQLPDEEIAIQFGTNLLGPIYTCRAAIPLMRAAGGGDIVNTSSEATIESFAMLSLYAITKAGLEAMGQALRTEYEKSEIRVTTLVQGVALGEGGGSTGWEWDPDHSAVAFQLWEQDGIMRRISGNHGAQQVDHVAEVHLFVVTRPRGQKLDVVRVRSY
jgi:NAD(P)-dependent dehydrogenase (short-subunit alcohol dehydrogenase family)